MDTPESSSLTEFTREQITVIFNGVTTHQDQSLLFFIHSWLAGDDKHKASLYYAAQELIVRHKLTPHVEPPCGIVKQSWADSASIMRGFCDDLVVNAEERTAIRQCIKAAETLDEIESLVC